MRAMRRTAANDVARNQAVNADQRRSAQVPHRPEKDAATSVGVVPADDAALARDTQRGAAAAASGGGADELKESLSFTAHAHTHASGEETPDKVTLFGRERPAPTRQLPAASASSASGSRSSEYSRWNVGHGMACAKLWSEMSVGQGMGQEKFAD